MFVVPILVDLADLVLLALALACLGIKKEIRSANLMFALTSALFEVKIFVIGAALGKATPRARP